MTHAAPNPSLTVAALCGLGGNQVRAPSGRFRVATGPFQPHFWGDQACIRVLAHLYFGFQLITSGR